MCDALKLQSSECVREFPGELEPSRSAGASFTLEWFERLPCLALLLAGGRVVGRNARVRLLTGISSAADFDVPLDQVLLTDTSWEPETDGCSTRFHASLLRRCGASIRVLGSTEKIEANGEPFTLLLMLERAAANVLDNDGGSSILEDVLDATPGATVVTHGGRILHVNEEFARMFDHPQLDCVGRDLDEMVLPDGRLHETEMIEHQLERSGRALLETQRRTRTGHNLDVLVIVSPLRLGSEARGQFVTYRDIHREKQEEARLKHSALHDGLTGLANRVLFLNRAELMLSRLRRRPDRNFAILFIDLDGFKKINDELGHAAGDAVLLEVADRLRRCVRPQDTIARFGGDEFALLLDETGSDEELRRVARRLQAEIGRVILLEDAEAKVAASIGITVANIRYRNAETMLHEADQAMYEAKTAGKATYRFSSGMSSAAVKTLVG